MADLLLGVMIGLGLGALLFLLRRRRPDVPAAIVRSDGHAIQVELVDPDAPAPAQLPEPEASSTSGLTLPGMILHATGGREERTALAAAWRRLERRVSAEPWAAVEQSLQHGMQDPQFWSRPDRFGVLARHALIDRVRAAMDTARGLESRLERSIEPGGRYSRDLVSRLALQLLVVGHGIGDVLENMPVEMVMSVQPTLDAAHDTAASLRWCGQLLEMYRQWAARRHMQWEEVPGPRGAPTLAVVSGFGAARVLLREVGLHTLEYAGGGDGIARVVVRVRAAATPAVVPESPAARHRALLAELERQTALLPIVRRYRLDAAPLVRDVTSGWRTGRPELVLGGDFDLLGEGVAPFNAD